jgi:quercetin dioxygenase-like cupin family protein
MSMSLCLKAVSQGGMPGGQREIKVGDVVHVKAVERQRYGAKADTTMGHIMITLAGSQATHG